VETILKVACAVILADVAVTVNGPPVVDPAVRRPLLFIVPPPDTDHETLVGATELPYWLRPVTENCCVPLATIRSVAGLTIMLSRVEGFEALAGTGRAKSKGSKIAAKSMPYDAKLIRCTVLFICRIPLLLTYEIWSQPSKDSYNSTRKHIYI
jgi:hypothetical protein